MKVKYPIVRIFIGAIVGLGLAALVGDPDSGIWFVIFLALGAIIGICVGAIAEGIRHSNSVAQSLMKEKGMDLEQLPASIADFIRLAIRKMRYRKKVRAEVTAELAAHFEDELRECKSDEEKEQKAAELIANFGDAKLLGVLLRRAKKRCRPLWRTMVARAFQAVGILILFFIVYIGWFLSGRPLINVDYLAQLNQMVRPVADESLNAAPLYTKATRLYGKCSDDFLLFFAENYKEIGDPEIGGRFRRGGSRLRAEELADDIHRLLSAKSQDNFAEKRRLKIESEITWRIALLPRLKYLETTVGERQFIKRWIADQKEALDLVVAGAQKPHYWRKYANKQNTTEMMAVLLPNLSKYRALANALGWRARLSAEQGRYEDAFNDLKSCYRLGQHIKGDNTFLIEQLVGMSFEALATQSLRDILSEYEIDSIVLTKLQKDLEQMVAGEDFIVSFETEKLFVYDVIQRCFTEGRFGGGHICLGELSRLEDLGMINSGDFSIFEKFWAELPHILFTHPNKQETREMAERYYAFWKKMARKSPASTRSEGIDLKSQSSEIIKGNILLEILAPRFGRVIEISYHKRTEFRALVTIIGLLRYKSDKGCYPENLQELMTAGYLNELPMDPWSDRPLVYKKTDDDFTLYSVGEDFEDDGGEVIRDYDGRVRMWEGEGDAVFWPVPELETPEERQKRLEEARELRKSRLWRRSK
ncbi:MAG: hypothetical protein ACYSTG_02615 [Planctomycetota bacterium]